MLRAGAKGEVATFIRVVVVLYRAVGGGEEELGWKYFIIMASTYGMVQTFPVR